MESSDNDDLRGQKSSIVEYLSGQYRTFVDKKNMNHVYYHSEPKNKKKISLTFFLFDIINYLSNKK